MSAQIGADPVADIASSNAEAAAGVLAGAVVDKAAESKAHDARIAKALALAEGRDAPVESEAAEAPAEASDDATAPPAERPKAEAAADEDPALSVDEQRKRMLAWQARKKEKIKARESALVQREAEINAKLAALEDKLKRASELDEIQRLASEDPAEVARRLGLDYRKLTEARIAESDPENEAKRVRREVERMREEFAAREKAREEAEAKAREEAAQARRAQEAEAFISFARGSADAHPELSKLAKVPGWSERIVAAANVLANKGIHRFGDIANELEREAAVVNAQIREAYALQAAQAAVADAKPAAKKPQAVPPSASTERTGRTKPMTHRERYAAALAIASGKDL